MTRYVGLACVKPPHPLKQNLFSFFFFKLRGWPYTAGYLVWACSCIAYWTIRSLSVDCGILYRRGGDYPTIRKTITISNLVLFFASADRLIPRSSKLVVYENGHWKNRDRLTPLAVDTGDPGLSYGHAGISCGILFLRTANILQWQRTSIPFRQGKKSLSLDQG